MKRSIISNLPCLFALGLVLAAVAVVNLPCVLVLGSVLTAVAAVDSATLVL